MGFEVSSLWKDRKGMATCGEEVRGEGLGGFEVDTPEGRAELLRGRLDYFIE